MHQYDEGSISERTVTDHLAALNCDVHKVDNSVGPRSIICWRIGKGTQGNRVSGQYSYTDKTRDKDGPMIPTVARGMDVHAIARLSIKHAMKTFEAMRAGKPAPEIDKEEMDAELAKIPHEPDEKLR